MLPATIERLACVVLRPASAVVRAWVWLMLAALPASQPPPRRTPPSLNDRQQALNHLIGGGHHLGAGRVGLLRHDQMAELGGDIDIGGFERVADDLAGGV